MEKQLKSDILSILKIALKKNQYSQSNHFDVTDTIRIYSNSNMDYFCIYYRKDQNEIIQATVSKYPSMEKDEVKLEYIMTLTTFEEVCKTIREMKYKIYNLPSRPTIETSKERQEELKTRIKQMKKELADITNKKAK